MEVKESERKSDGMSEFLRSQIVKVMREEGASYEVHLEADEEIQKGQHFLSLTYNVIGTGKKSDGQTVTIPFFVKCTIKNEIWKQGFKTDLLFQKEVDFYSVVLPTFNDFQRSHFQPPCDEPEDNGLGVVPKCYLALTNGMEGVILLEDLMENGFSMLDREKGLDLEKSLLVMRSLAKLHAYSYAMKQKDPDTFQLLSDLTTEVFLADDNEETFGKLFQANALAVMEAARTHCPEAAEKLGIWLKDGIFKQMERIVWERDEYSVINHGDPWINNMLFRESDGGKWEVRFVDYQILRHCSPATDISYFLMTSTEPSVRDEHTDELLREYHTMLVEWLTNFGCRDPETILPYGQLEVEMKKYSFLGIGLALIFLPLYHTGVDESPDLGSFEDTSFGHLTRLHRVGMEKEVARLRMVSLVKHCFERGYI